MSEIIKVHFTPEKGVVYKTGLKQWDRGKKLEISGLDVTENVQVHFSLTDSVGTAKCYDATVEEGKICVDIPQFILEKEGTRGYSYYAYAWIYVSTENMGETIREIVFSIDCRAKPEDYISRPDDIKTWEELEKRIKELKENGVSDEQIAQAVEDYLKENNISADVYMRVSDGYVQFSSDNETWENVIALSELKGQDGKNGSDGQDGYTPQKGTDYFTEEDKTEIVNEVVESLDFDSVGGSPLFVVTITRDEENGYSADKTFEEIVEAYESGKVVQCSLYGENIIDIHAISDWEIAFMKTNIDGLAVIVLECYIYDDNIVEVIDYRNDIPTMMGANELTTKDKTIVGAINELNSKFNSLEVGDEVSY